MTPVVIDRSQHTISRGKISPEALKVLNRLHEVGFLAYLAGGGVRDLLLGRQPKDFDIATDAHPNQVKRLFRDCRLVGRRFRLAHVFFRNTYIEVATFRAHMPPDAQPVPEHLFQKRDGVLNGISLTDEQKELASTRVLVVHEDSKTGPQFTAILDKLLEEHHPDIVFVDPAFSYLGGDASSQKEVTPFLRNLLNPLIHRHNVGLWLNHHTNKPVPVKDKKAPPVDLGAYLGAGSAEWCNWARAVVALQPVPKTRIYRLSAPKRGPRLHWRDDDDQPMYHRFIAHAREPGIICWRDAEDSEIPTDSITKARTSVQDIVEIIGDRTMHLDDLTRAVVKAIEPRYVGSKSDFIRRTASRHIQTALKSGALRETAGGIVATAVSEPCPNPDMSGRAEKETGGTPS